jgi:hypothetical protein
MKHPGVSLFKRTNKTTLKNGKQQINIKYYYRAYITVDKKSIYLGVFKKQKDAIDTYNSAFKKFYKENCSRTKNITSFVYFKNIESKFKIKCLDKNYNTRKKVKWKCKFGHVFFRHAISLKKMGWVCPMCNNLNKIKQIKQISAKNNILCLSNKYNYGKLKFKCEHGHVFTKTAYAFKKYPTCNKNHKNQ